MKRGSFIMVAVCASLGMFAGFGAASADPGAATTPDATVTVPAKPASSPGDQMICKVQPPELGSRIGGRRMCMTRNQWDNLSAEDQAKFHDYQNQELQHPHGFPG